MNWARGVSVTSFPTRSDIRKYLSRIEAGEGDQIRAEMPSLLTKYPNHPGVLYLQGLLTRDGTEAVRVYQSIVDNFPRSEWRRMLCIKSISSITP
jgi:hypothetical protein